MATLSTLSPLSSLSHYVPHSSRASTPSPTNLTVNHDGCLANHPLNSLLDRCTNQLQLKQIHAHMLRNGLFFDPYSNSKLIAAIALPPLSHLNYAGNLFDNIPKPNLYTWNTLIRAYASNGEPIRCLLTFLRMFSESPDLPNKFTYPFAIKAAAETYDLDIGRGLHGMVVKMMLGSDIFILNSLIHCYGVCGDVESACRAFVRMSKKDVVSWNSMIMGFVKWDFLDEALDLFQQMELENVKPNDVTMTGVFSACAKKGDLVLGRLMHSCVKMYEVKSNLILNNSLLDMYTKCGSIAEAKRLFDGMQEKDVVSWTTMLVGYARVGHFYEARHVFDEMPCKDIAAWNALISGYEQNGKPKEAISLFRELLAIRSIKPDELTLVSFLSACAQMGAVDLGRWIHAYINKQDIEQNCHLTTSLINLYSKCGDLERALAVFHSAKRKEVFVWSAMIAGLAMHGHGRAAIDLFSRMEEAGVKPNSVTFTNVLSACSHSGLVEKGRIIFDEMEPVHGVVRDVNHYSCMVDILGRAGLLEEALKLKKDMPLTPSALVWSTLLGACKLHGNVNLAEMAFGQVLKLEPGNHGAYVLLSNIYAKSEMWNKVSGIRKLMRNSGLKKEPGCSSIEVNGITHEFLAADSSHPMAGRIYAELDEIVLRLKSTGYVPDKSHLFQFVEEEDKKEQALSLHSEKLAIAFGLLSLAPSQHIRIVKNLRICGDCHTFAKIISKLYDREILLRDRYRFHHFKEGRCSCMDYW